MLIFDAAAICVFNTPTVADFGTLTFPFHFPAMIRLKEPSFDTARFNRSRPTLGALFVVITDTIYLSLQDFLYIFFWERFFPFTVCVSSLSLSLSLSLWCVLIHFWGEFRKIRLSDSCSRFGFPIDGVSVFSISMKYCRFRSIEAHVVFVVSSFCFLSSLSLVKWCGYIWGTYLYNVILLS